MAEQNKTAAIIGGYGMAGAALARALLTRPGFDIKIGGRSEPKAKRFAASLDPRGARVTGMGVDLGAPATIDSFLRGVDWLILACPANWTRNAADAAIRAGCHWMDIQLSLETKLNDLRSLESRFRDHGLACITDGGFHPGLPSFMVRWALTQYEHLHRARIMSLLRPDWTKFDVTPATAKEFAAELSTMKLAAKVGGAWQELGFGGRIKHNFGGEFAKVDCFPMRLEELVFLNEASGITDLGFYVSGFGGKIDMIDLPFISLMVKMRGAKAHQWAGNKLVSKLKKACKPPYDNRLVLSTEHGPLITISHRDAYALTAAPAAACLWQVLDSPPPGLHFQGHVLDPNSTWGMLQDLGVSCEGLGQEHDVEVIETKLADLA